MMINLLEIERAQIEAEKADRLTHYCILAMLSLIFVLLVLINLLIESREHEVYTVPEFDEPVMEEKIDIGDMFTFNGQKYVIIEDTSKKGE